VHAQAGLTAAQANQLVAVAAQLESLLGCQ
jgi:hypothetical protein